LQAGLRVAGRRRRIEAPCRRHRRAARPEGAGRGPAGEQDGGCRANTQRPCCRAARIASRDGLVCCLLVGGTAVSFVQGHALGKGYYVCLQNRALARLRAIRDRDRRCRRLKGVGAAQYNCALSQLSAGCPVQHETGSTAGVSARTCGRAPPNQRRGR